MVQGFLHGIHHIQVRLELHKTTGDKDKNIANASERELHLEAVIRTEEEEPTPRIAAIRRDETENLIESVKKLVQQMSVGNENNARSSDGQKTTATEEKCNAMETEIGNTVQENEQELEPQDQIRAKEMTIPVGKTTMTNVDYVGKRTTGRRTAVFVLLVELLPIINEIALGIKGRNKPM